MSSGLTYTPGMYAETSELVELAKCNRLLVDTPSFLGGGEHSLTVSVDVVRAEAE